MPHVIIFGLPVELEGTAALTEFKGRTVPAALVSIDQLHVTMADVVVSTPLDMAGRAEPTCPEAIIRLNAKDDRTPAVRRAAAEVVGVVLQAFLVAQGCTFQSIGVVTQMVSADEGFFIATA
jgi:hypothetical protein